MTLLEKRGSVEYWVRELTYREKNKIKGRCFYLNTIVPERLNGWAEQPGVLRPCGMCLSTAKRYFIQEDPMGWDILFMTDDEDHFNEATKDHYAGEKGLLRHLSCWEVLEEMQREGGDHYELNHNPLITYYRLLSSE
jgi:hypothetical protein